MFEMKAVKISLATDTFGKSFFWILASMWTIGNYRGWVWRKHPRLNQMSLINVNLGRRQNGVSNKNGKNLEHFFFQRIHLWSTYVSFRWKSILWIPVLTGGTTYDALFFFSHGRDGKICSWKCVFIRATFGTWSVHALTKMACRCPRVDYKGRPTR